MANLDYIEELGIGENLDNNDTEVESNDQEEESQEDFVQEPEEKPSDNIEADTEQPNELQSLVDSYKSQIDGMEKRIADKDEFINELRDASKQKEADKQQEVDTEKTEDDDFWSNPEQTIKDLKLELKEQREATKIQQMQTHEIHYANTVDDYWKTVNQDTLKEAVSMDSEFATEFNKSNEPYKTAYEYLKQKNQTRVDSDKAMKDKIIQDYLKENGMEKKESKEVPPNVNVGGKSGSTSKKATSDGFAAMFGDGY